MIRASAFVLRLSCVLIGRPCVSARVFCVRSRLLFDARAKQDGLRKDTFLFRRGSRSPFARSRVAVRLSDSAGSFRDYAFSGGDPDGETKGRRERSRRRGRVRFCVIILALRRFPRGVRWGCAPQTAPKSLRLSGLSSRCGGAVLVRIRRAVTRVHGKTRPSPIYARAGRAVLR